MDRRELVARVLTGNSKIVTEEMRPSDGADGILFEAVGPKKPIWRHGAYLNMADRILDALEKYDA